MPVQNGNDGIYNVLGFALSAHTLDVEAFPYGWNEFTLPASTLISSVFIFCGEWGTFYRDNFLLSVGDSTPPYNNPVCYDFGPA